MKVLFWLVKNKINKSGECPIYCRITISGKRVEIFTGVYATEGEFDNRKKKLRGNSELAESKNRQLERLKYRIFNTYHNEVLNNNIPTAQEIKVLLETKRTKTVLFSDLLYEYANEKYSIQGNLTRRESHFRYIAIINKALKELKLSKNQISQCDTYFLDQIAHQNHRHRRLLPCIHKKNIWIHKINIIICI